MKINYFEFGEAIEYYPVVVLGFCRQILKGLLLNVTRWVQWLNQSVMGILSV